MMTVLFFEPQDQPPTPPEDLAAALCRLGVVLAGADAAAYRPGTWTDSATGSRLICDLGEPPLESDTEHPPRAYAGWRTVLLAIHIPFCGPHWQAVEALCLVERLLAEVPGLAHLDCEDTARDGEADPGPYPWSRPRLIASWQRQHEAWIAGRPRMPRMHRGSSLRLWRYRRERAAGLAARPEVVWPEALVLARRTSAGLAEPAGAAVWQDATRPFVLPPVELVVVVRPDGAGVVTARALLEECAGEELAQGLARLILPDAATRRFHAETALLAQTGFAALSDEEWVD